MWPLLSVVTRGNPSLWIASREGVIWPLLSVVTRGNPSLWVASREGDRKRGGWHSRVVVVQQRLGVRGNITQGDDAPAGGQACPETSSARQLTAAVDERDLELRRARQRDLELGELPDRRVVDAPLFFFAPPNRTHGRYSVVAKAPDPGDVARVLSSGTREGTLAPPWSALARLGASRKLRSSPPSVTRRYGSQSEFFAWRHDDDIGAKKG